MEHLIIFQNPKGTANLSISGVNFSVDSSTLNEQKEISQSGDEDYKTQISKHWDEDVSDITGENAADLAGKGTGSSNGHYLNANYDSLTADLQAMIDAQNNEPEDKPANAPAPAPAPAE